MSRRREKKGRPTLRRRVVRSVGLSIAASALYALLVHFVFEVIPDDKSVVVGWSAGDALMCGVAMISACLAIWGVYLTLDNNRVQFVENSRLGVIPCISIVELVEKNKKSYFNEHRGTKTIHEGDGESMLRSSSEDASYCIVEPGQEFAILGETITYKRDLTQRQWDLAGHRDSISLVKNGFSFGPSLVKLVPIQFINIGLGAAVNFRRGIERRHNQEERRYTQPRTLKPGDACMLGIYVDMSDESVFGEYEICLSYYDVLGNEYTQTFNFSVTMEGEESPGGSMNPSISYEYLINRLLVDRAR